MAVYVTEHRLPKLYQRSVLHVPTMPPIATQKLTNGGTAVQSNTFDAATRMIGVHTDAIVSIKVGTNPTATTSDKRMAANTTEYFIVEGGQKISVINNV